MLKKKIETTSQPLIDEAVATLRADLKQIFSESLSELSVLQQYDDLNARQHALRRAYGIAHEGCSEETQKRADKAYAEELNARSVHLYRPLRP